MPHGLLLPGRAYGPDHPLLFFAARALEQSGRTVRALTWSREVVAATGGPDATARVEAAVEAAVEAEVSTLGEPAVVVAKSLGSRAAALAARRAWPAVWLTPLLVDDGVHAAIAGSLAPQLVVGGREDPFFDVERAARLGDLPHVEVLVVPGADHALLTPGDVVRGARVHAEVCEAVVGFLARLDAR